MFSSVMTFCPLRSGCGKLKPILLVVVHRRLDFFHPVDLLELALRLRRLAGLGAETVGEFLQPRDVALLVFVGGEQLLLGGGALHEKIIVVAAITVELARADFHDAADDVIEKFAVVRNDHDRAGIRREIFLKPQQRLEVEMVRRFVEQKQIRLLHEQPRQMRAHDPAAAQFARRRSKSFSRKPRPDKICFAFASSW